MESPFRADARDLGISEERWLDICGSKDSGEKGAMVGRIHETFRRILADQIRMDNPHLDDSAVQAAVAKRLLNDDLPPDLVRKAEVESWAYWLTPEQQNA